MHRQRFDLQLTQYDERGRRATFYTTGMEHSPTGAIGTSWERTPWHAMQRAAWEALRNAEAIRIHDGLTGGDSLNNAAPTGVSTQRKAKVGACGQ
jgi:hypothetical protein